MLTSSVYLSCASGCVGLQLDSSLVVVCLACVVILLVGPLSVLVSTVARSVLLIGALRMEGWIDGQILCSFLCSLDLVTA